MIAELRRKDRSMASRPEMELLLRRMVVGRLGLITAEGPYVVALNYLFFEGHIYFHSGQAGRKIEALRAEPSVT
jgi:nitroimidazol reductase NimA-like FMN-containing flavoprotein (pyridoxamine 5'-phosphate oxidase superfamily)